MRPPSERPGKDVARFGIRVTAPAAGQFLTDWAGGSMERTPRAIAGDDAVLDPFPRGVARQER